MAERTIASNVVGLSRLLQLEWEARQAPTMDDIAFLAVNETRQLVNYDRALLWLPWQRRVAAVSGVSAADRTAPFIQWASRLSRHLSRQSNLNDVCTVTADMLPNRLGNELAEWSPGAVLWLPLRVDDAARDGGLLLMRSEPFEENEKQVLGRLAGSFAHALSLLRLRRRGAIPRSGRRLVRRFWFPVLAVAAIAALFIPVRLTILVPAQVVPTNPHYVSAPIDGVVARMLVNPNQTVARDQIIVELEETELRARLTISEKTVAAAVAELSRARQRAFTDARSKADLQLLQAKLDEKRTERDYAASRLQWATIRAPAAGTAIYNDPNEWAGRPVSVGERIMIVADPADVRLDVWIPAGDAVSLPAGAKVLFFQNAAPETPVEANLSVVSYEAQARPDGTAAHRGKAGFVAGADSPRLGLTGTAKIHGEEVSLMYLIARRPLATLRRWFGV
ncbi:MAG: hypothetical protein ACI9JL_002668 [Paracoccaceae bacterium]|jgi:hypothetical protein